MTQLFIILMCASAIVAAFLDVYSSWRNNPIPEIVELNRMFRLPDGRCDIKRLIVFKLVLLALALALALVLYRMTDAGIIAFIVFPVMAAVHMPVVVGNFKLHGKFSRTNARRRGVVHF